MDVHMYALRYTWDIHMCMYIHEEICVRELWLFLGSGERIYVFLET